MMHEIYPVPDPVDGGEYGPKMRALTTPRMKRFVIALLNQSGKPDQTAAYVEAGYMGSTRNALQINASILAHDQRIQEAIQEEAGRRLKLLLPAALAAIEEIVVDPQHKDRAKIADGIVSRAGLDAPVEHRHGLAGDTAMLARIKMLAERNGIPLQSLLGERITRTIEHEPVPVQVADEEDEEY